MKSKLTMFLLVVMVSVFSAASIFIATRHSAKGKVQTKTDSAVFSSANNKNKHPSRGVDFSDEDKPGNEPELLEKVESGDIRIEKYADASDETRECNVFYFKNEPVEDNNSCMSAHSKFTIVNIPTIGIPVVVDRWSEYFMNGEGTMNGFIMYTVNESGRHRILDLITGRDVDRCVVDACKKTKNEWLKGSVNISEGGEYFIVTYKFSTSKHEIGTVRFKWVGGGFEAENKEIYEISEKYRP